MSSRMIIETPMRTAMLRSVAGIHSPGRFGAQVRQADARDAGKRSINSVNAHLSYRTAEKLKKMGYLVA